MTEKLLIIAHLMILYSIILLTMVLRYLNQAI